MDPCQTFIFTQQFIPQIGDAEKKNLAGAEISNGLNLGEGSRRSQNKVQFIVKPAGIISNVRPLATLACAGPSRQFGWVGPGGRGKSSAPKNIPSQVFKAAGLTIFLTLL